jgi:hypothetical protein
MVKLRSRGHSRLTSSSCVSIAVLRSIHTAVYRSHSTVVLTSASAKTTVHSCARCWRIAARHSRLSRANWAASRHDLGGGHTARNGSTASTVAMVRLAAYKWTHTHHAHAHAPRGWVSQSVSRSPSTTHSLVQSPGVGAGQPTGDKQERRRHGRVSHSSPSTDHECCSVAARSPYDHPRDWGRWR